MRTRSLTLGLLVLCAALMLACAPASAPAPSAATAPPAANTAPAAGSATTAPAANAPAEILVGAALALTGSSSREGGFFKKAYELAAKEWNANGGIMVKEFGKRIPIRLIIYDDKTDPTTATQLYEKLATEDKVSFFLGGYSTPVVQAETIVPEKYNIPYVNGGGATSEIYNRGMKNVFGLLAPISKLSETLLKWMGQQQDAGKLPKPVKIALTGENSSHGVEFRKGVQDAAKASPDRFQVVFDEAFELNLKDADPLLQKVKASNADVFLADARVADYTTIQRHYAELGLYHLVISYGPRGPEKAARDALGPASNYIVAANWWDKSLSDAPSKAFAQKYTAAYNEDPEWFAAMGYETARTLFTAIENAGTLDRTKVREALAGIKISPSLVIGGVVQFAPNGQIQTDYLMTENLPDGVAIIYPTNLATGPAVVPIPKSK